MTSFTTRNRRQRMQAEFERRQRWNRSVLMGSTGLGGVLAGLALGAGGAWGQIAPNTLPTGGQVTAGSATINQANPSTLNINQTTNRAVINWNSFDVGSSASVNFYQPNAGSWTLNRVTNSVAPSQILGHITANGNIAVINPNGVIFGAGSRIDVNGLIATTANISDQNFMSGTMKFDQAGSPTATVINQGDITVQDAGLVAFVAPGVQNSGTINARLGKVSLAAGQKFTLDLYGDNLVSIAADGQVTEAPIGPNGQKVAALVDNSGKIVAEGGQIQLTARQASRLVDNAINMSGVVQAQSAYVDKNGDIVLDGGTAGDVKVSGTLDASGQKAGTKGGNITVTGKDDVIVGSTATLNASGDAGGGKIRIGGDLHGQGTTPTAKRTLVATGAQVKADAVTSGNGGTIVVWSDTNTQIGGVLSAQGGLVQGNGGFIETSSKGDFMVAGSADIRLNAPNGLGGTWLLDPQNITVTSPSAGTTNQNDQFSDNGQNNTISAATIQTALGSGTVNLQATNDITVSEAITSATGSLVLRAGRDININAAITLTGGTFSATANDSGAGTNFPGGGVVAGGAVGRLDSTSGDISITSAISATGIGLTVTNSTAAITFGSPTGSGGTLNYNPGSITIGAALTATGASGDVVLSAASSTSNATVNSAISAKNNITFNVGGNVTLSNNLTANSDASGGGAISGTSTHIYVTNNTAQVQDGIDVVGSGGTVTLTPSGTGWTENLNIAKTMSLIGGTNDSIVAASGAAPVINVTGGNVTISNLFVNDGGTTVANGVLVNGATGITLLNVTVKGSTNTAFSGAGVSITSATSGTITVSGGGVQTVAGDGYHIDPPGPVIMSGLGISGAGGDGVEITGVTGTPTISVTGSSINDVNGNGIYIHDNASGVNASISIGGNTIGNSNVDFGFGGGIGANGILLANNVGYTVRVQSNLIGVSTGGSTPAPFGGQGIRVDGTAAAGSATSVSIVSNSLGVGAPAGTMQGGIYVAEQNSLATVVISGNSIDNVDSGGVSGITVQGPIAGGGTGTVVVSSNSIAHPGSNGIVVVDGLKTSITSNTIGAVPNDGIRVVLSNVSSNATLTLTGNSITNPTVRGIYINNVDVDNTLTTTFGGNNTIGGLSGTADGLVFDGARLAVSGNALNSFTFLATGGWTGNFINLQNGALFQPGQPTAIDAGSAFFDANFNGVIDANEAAVTNFDPTTIVDQTTLDAAWANEFAVAQTIESRIHDYRDDPTLGRINVLGNVVVVYGPTDFGGGLFGIQNAIKITPTNGYLFVNSGDYGEFEPAGDGTTTPLTISRSMSVIGRQGFTSAATGLRTAGGGSESILDFAATDDGVTGGIVISANSVTVRGFDIAMDTPQGAGVSVTGANRTNIAVTDNFIHGNSGNGIETAPGGSIISGNFNGNSIYSVGDSGILLTLASGASSFSLSGNHIIAGTDASDNAIELDASFGANTALVLMGNTIEGAGGTGILATNFGQLTVSGNTLASSNTGAVIGGDGIRINGGTADSTVSGNTIAAGAGNVLTIGGAGIRLSSPATNFSISGNTIGTPGGPASAATGIFIEGASGNSILSILGNTINNVSKDGITVFNQGAFNDFIVVGTTTILNVGGTTGAGIELVDNSGAGLTGLKILTGNTIDNAPNGLIFDGKDTRVLNPGDNPASYVTPTAGSVVDMGDIVIGSTIGSVASSVGEYYIQLKNNALYGTDPNPFKPIQYSVNNVTFNSVKVSDLNPEFYDPSPVIDSDREVLADLESKIYHYFDDPTLGFIRLKPNSVTLDPTVGLNGIQLAITVSSKVNVDTIYLLPGTYGDRSDLLNNVSLGTNGSLLVDRNIKIIGAQGPRDTIDGTEDGVFQLPGVSAKTGGRNFADPTTESILDFNNATVTGSSQGGILISGNAGTTNLGTVALVSIDGVDIQMGTGDTFGIRIDSSVARSNITVLDSFALGVGAQLTGSLIDNNGGAQLLTNVTIKDNSIANATGAGVTIHNAIGVDVRNNSVQFVGQDGIAVTDAHFSTSVSGNMVDTTGLNGILLTGRNDTVGNDVTVQANVVSNTGTAAGQQGDGIHVGTASNPFFNVLVGGTGTLGNTVNNVGMGAGSFGDGIHVSHAINNVTVQGNTIANTGTIVGALAGGGDGIHVGNTGGSVSIDQNTIASGANVFNNGVQVVTTAGNVVVTTNTIGTAAFGTSVGNGVLTSHTTGKVTIGGATSSLGNTINNTGDNGVYVFDTGNGVLVQNNTVANLANVGTSSDGGNGILVQQTTGGDVTVLRNTVGNVAGFGSQNGTIFDGDGILVEETTNNVQVGSLGGLGNSVFDADQDGIEVRNTGLTVKVINNRVQTVGIGSSTGDGIVVTNTGTQAGSGNGNVSVTDNSITDVTGNGTADATDGLTSGDGVRVSNVDGNVLFFKNQILRTGDDGVQINNVLGTVNVDQNIITTIGTGSGNGGDGIQVDKTGRLSSYGTTVSAGGGVTISNNTINNTTDTGIDVDDSLTAGDGIRVAHIDGQVLASNNYVANLAGGDISNDGIQISDITTTVKVDQNHVGSANASIGIGTTDGDGIVIENTGGFATTLGISHAGAVIVVRNVVMNVIGSGIDRDGASNASVIASAGSHSTLTAGDGVRIGFADGSIYVGDVATPSFGNTIQTVGNDGIEVFFATGQTSVLIGDVNGINIGNNKISTVGVNTTDGDGIQLDSTGRYALGGVSVPVNIALNGVNNVIGTGFDRDDLLTAGDGIRVNHVDGSLLLDRNAIGSQLAGSSFTADKIGNDGIQVYVVTGTVSVIGNQIGQGASISNDTTDGDGIQIDKTGTKASLVFGTAGGGSVAVAGNSVSNVRGTGVADRDDGLSAGDGLRINQVDGTVSVGPQAISGNGFTATGNTFSNIGDDGVQIHDITQTVAVITNTITDVGVLSVKGDGIQIDQTGTGGSGHDGDGNVTVQNNTITNVAIGSGGTGALDNDDTLSSNDGIRISIVDGDVVVGGAGTLANTITKTGDDGIETFDVERTVTVLNNQIDSVSTGSLQGDGIVVINTGQYGGGTIAGGGNVTINGNTVSNVNGVGVADSDDGLSSGDGIRVSSADGSVLFNNNSIFHAGDDGVQIYGVTRSVTGTNNRITGVGSASGAGDGIVVDKTGSYAPIFGTASQLGSVTLTGNVVNDVNGTAVVDADDSLTSGDGIRVAQINGDVLISGNTLANLAGGDINNDGIQVWGVTGAGNSSVNGVTISNNLVGSANASIGNGTTHGDGIVVENTGNFTQTGPTLSAIAGGGNVLVTGNTVINVVGSTGAKDTDGNIGGVPTGTEFLSAGDGVRVAFVDGTASVASNSISNVADDGVQVWRVAKTVSVLNNAISLTGAGGGAGDGIQVDITGSYADSVGIGTLHGGAVTISGNTINDVRGVGLDPDDGLSAGDGIRADAIDGNVRVLTNTIANLTGGGIANDGIQVRDVVGGSASLTSGVTIDHNLVGSANASIGINSTDGDGIVVENTGTFGISGQFAGSGSVTISSNTVMNVVGTGAADRDDGRTSGDGVRTYKIDQNVLTTGNLIDPIGDDGIEHYLTSGTVLVLNNTIDSVGNGSAWGDGIQITQTGPQFTGVAVPSGVTVAGNTVTHVISTGGTDPDDNHHAGDGIRITSTDGNIVVGGSTGTVTNGNTVAVTRDDGIQIDIVNGEVLVSYNTVETISTGPGEGDGIVVTNVGAVYTGFGTQHNVTVTNNLVRDVIGTGADSDDGRTAGDGVRVGSVDGSVRVTSNNIFNINDDGVQVANVIGPVTVASNTINTIGGSGTGDGVEVGQITGNVSVSSNTISNVTDLDGVNVSSISGTVLVNNNSITSAKDDGVDVNSVTGDVTVISNTITTIGGTGTGDGVSIASITGNVSVLSNTISHVTDDDGIHVFNTTGNVLIGDGTLAGRNFVSTVAAVGIEANSIGGSVRVDTNSVDNTGTDGIHVYSVSVDATVINNTLQTIGTTNVGNGVEVNSITGNATASNNTVDKTAEDGVLVYSVGGGAFANGNTITTFGTSGTGTGIDVHSVSLNANVNNNRVSDGTGDGIDVFSIGGSATATGNTVQNVGTDGTGNGMQVYSVSNDVNVSNNRVSTVASIGISAFSVGGSAFVNNNSVQNVGTGGAFHGIEVYSISNNVNANNNSIANVTDTGLIVYSVGGNVTASSNTIANTGTAGSGNGLEVYSISNMVVIDSNSVTGAHDDAVSIRSLGGGFTITNNVMTNSDIGLFVGSGSVNSTPGINVITGNSITNNATWGLVVDVGNTAGATVLPGDTFPTLNITLKTNTIIGNGGIPDATLSQGGGVLNNNLMFILDARGNEFGGVPFTTPTHFENPNTGGPGDAVSDWVRIDIPVLFRLPEVHIQLLLDNFARGPHPLTPGDVLAIGPAFDQNGNLFDPYFVDVFGTPFGLGGNPAGVVTSVGPATDYAMCFLANMWQATSCRIGPPLQ